MRRPVLGIAAGFLALLAVSAAASSAGAISTGASLTIVATPNPIFSGDDVLVYGQLNVTDPAGKQVVLHGRASPLAPFTVLKQTTADSRGFYEFAGAGGPVETNQSWFVTAPGRFRSRTVHERVASELTLAASSTDGQTREPLTFTGHVDPAGFHVGQQVRLQRLVGDTGSAWKTIGHASIDSSGNFTISQSFLLPGADDLRASLGGNASNTPAVSDTLTVTIEQAQKPLFTIATSASLLDAGGTATISGTLYQVGSPETPLPGTSVALWGKRLGGGVFAPVTAIPATTAPDGGFSFTVTPTVNEIYQARTALGPGRRRSAQLFEGVRDVVTLSPSVTSVDVGGTVSFSGTVTPDKAGHAVYLERLGADGAFHVVAARFVGATSAYEFSYTVGSAGTKTFRVRIAGGPENVGAVAPTATITAVMPPLSSLPLAT
jgi:hypothetical protein